MRLLSTISAVAVAALLGLPARAETVTLKATMNAASEVPADDSKASGTVTVTYDTVTKLMSFEGNYSGLSGPATAAHFHGPAEAGKNAGVAVKIDNPATPFKGSATLTDAQAADLLAGHYYVNVHTDAHKGGEIRGSGDEIAALRARPTQELDPALRSSVGRM
jgi:hypothetical protein